MFTQIARIIAVLGAVAGFIRAAIGFAIPTGYLGPADVALSRYAPGAASAGETIDGGLYTVFFCVALGTLAEIGMTLRRRD